MTNRRVFSQGDDWRRDTIVGGDENRLSFAVKYGAAASALADLALAQRLQDLYFLPICYLYRHAIELSLKDLIQQTDRLICLVAQDGTTESVHCHEGVNGETQLLRGHNLRRLLNGLADRFVLASGQPIPDEVHRVVEDIDAFDPSSQTFRYHESTMGEPSFPTQEHYDLGQVQEALDGLLEYLGGMGSWLDAQQTEYIEMRTYFAE